MSVSCALCDGEIHTGERREIRDAETVHEWCGLGEDVASKYTFYINNPAHRPEVSFSLWYDAGNYEFPILSNSGGLNTINSRDKDFGDGIPMDTDFVIGFGYGWHWLACYMPPDEERFESALEDVEEMYYPGKMGSHERWALFTLLGHCWWSPEPVPSEWGPLVDFADQCTEMGVPTVRESDLDE